jgi:hypothetical protein
MKFEFNRKELVAIHDSSGKAKTAGLSPALHEPRQSFRSSVKRVKTAATHLQHYLIKA